MRISKCYIAGFGRIKDFKYEFKDGFNIILEEFASNWKVVGKFASIVLNS